MLTFGDVTTLVEVVMIGVVVVGVVDVVVGVVVVVGFSVTPSHSSVSLSWKYPYGHVSLRHCRSQLLCSVQFCGL